MGRRLTSALVLALALLLGLYGAFALLYGGDAGGGSTYVTLAGHRYDAHRVGAVCLVVTVLLVWLAARLAPMSGRRSGGARRRH